MRVKKTLLPCPFCGGKAKFHVGLNNYNDVEVICEKCSCSGGCFDDSVDSRLQVAVILNKRDAGEHWNSRYQMSPTSGRWIKIKG